MARVKKSKNVSDEELIRQYQNKRDNLRRLEEQRKKDKREGFESTMIRDRITEVGLELNVLLQELRKRGIQL